MEKVMVRFVLLTTFILFGGCSGEQDNSTKEHVFQTQVEALDKARDVEKLLQDSNQQQQRAIEAQSSN